VLANLSSVFQQAATDHGERPALRLDGLVLSYSQLRDAAGRATCLLVPPAADQADGDEAVILYTSGTTGIPREPPASRRAPSSRTRT
jgi:acyl-CoA synthetase (AMP-forming)/AMP-acid ligase II